MLHFISLVAATLCVRQPSSQSMNNSINQVYFTQKRSTTEIPEHSGTKLSGRTQNLSSFPGVVVRRTSNDVIALWSADERIMTIFDEYSRPFDVTNHVIRRDVEQ